MRALILTAAGLSQRFGRNKLTALYQGKPLILQTLEAFDPSAFDQIVITYAKPYEKEIKDALGTYNGSAIKWVEGGETRFDSVKNGVLALEASINCVFIHDAARPNVSQSLLKRLSDASKSHPAVIPGIAIVETVKRVKNNQVVETLDRSTLFRIQTPQVFHKKDLLEAYSVIGDDTSCTDESMVIEKAGKPVLVVEGESANIKITTPNDLKVETL